MNTVLPYLSASLVGAGSVSAGQMALIGAIVVVTGMTLISNARRRGERGPSAKTYAREQVARIREERAIKDDISELMLELQKAAREINAQLDAKYIRLERCIAQADERAERMRHLLSDTSEVRYETASPDSVELSFKNGRRGRLEVSTRERIASLRRAGQSAEEIAADVGIPVGEVKLILDLNPIKSASAADSERSAATHAGSN